VSGSTTSEDRNVLRSGGLHLYRNFLLDAVAIFFFAAWFWLLITAAFDLFRRHAVSGWGKASWVIGFIVFPFFFVLLYLIFQGRGMAERNQQQARPGAR
jgi:hypothetical protein